MMPACSCAVPGRKPGTSTNVTSGMLKASQKRTNRAAFTDASMSSTPARIIGCCATTPTDLPSSRANAQMMFCAQPSWTSSTSSSSTTLRMTSFMSYALFEAAGTMCMDVRAAQLVEGDVFVGDRLHHVRAGHEHVARVADHDDEVGDGG